MEVHVDDDTKRGRDKIDRDTDRWSRGLGSRIGANLLRGITTGLFGLFKFLGILTMLTAKMALLGLVIGTVGAAITALLGGIVHLMPWVTELVQAAIAASGALLLIPGAIAIVIAAVSALKIGLQGVGAALKAGLSGDLEAFNKALEKLAPNAAQFVQEVIKIKPAFERVRVAIQNSLFADLAELLRKMAEVYLPILETGLSGVASKINAVFKAVGGFFLGAQTQADISLIFGNASVAIGNLAQALVPILSILRDVAVVASKLVAELTGRLVPVFQRWADTIAQMRADGSLEQLILDGLAALKQFVGLAGDLIGILSGIFKAAGAGGGLFAFFDRLNTLVNSVSGQAALTEIFNSLAAAATALAPVLIVLLKALVPILEGFSQIAIAFAPGLMILVTELGKALASLAPGFIALAPLLEVVAESFQPLADILVDLVVNAAPYLVEFFRLLSDLLRELAPAAAPLGKAIGLLVLAFADLIAALGPLIAGGLELLADILIAILVPLEPLIRQSIPLLTVLFHQLFDAMQPLIPAINAFVMVFVQELLKHKDELLTLFTQWTQILTVLAQKLAGEFVQALADIIPMLPQLITNGLQFAQALLELTNALMPLIILFLDATNQTGAWQILIISLIGWLKYYEIALQGVTIWVNYLIALWNAAIRALDWLIDKVRQAVGAFTGGFGAIRSAVYGAISSAVDTIYSFGTSMYYAGANLISNLVNGITSRFNSVRGVISSVASTIRGYLPFSPAKVGPLSGRGDLMYAGQSLVSRLVEGVQREMGVVRSTADQLAGMFGVGGPGAFALAGVPAGAAPQQPQELYVLVQIGDRPVREMVRGEIVSNPDAVAAATDEGHRQNAGNTGRKRIGDI